MPPRYIPSLFFAYFCGIASRRFRLLAPTVMPMLVACENDRNPRVPAAA